MKDEEATTRARQARVLRAALSRLEGGDAALPTDVLDPIEREIELRRDDEAIAAAWAEQGSKEAETWLIARLSILA